MNCHLKTLIEKNLAIKDFDGKYIIECLDCNLSEEEFQNKIMSDWDFFGDVANIIFLLQSENFASKNTFSYLSKLISNNIEHVEAKIFDELSNVFKKDGYSVEKKCDESGMSISFTPQTK